MENKTTKETRMKKSKGKPRRLSVKKQAVKTGGGQRRRTDVGRIRQRPIPVESDVARIRQRERPIPFDVARIRQRERPIERGLIETERPPKPD
jgi:hypothetical protein